MGADGGERFGDGSPNISLGPGPGLCSFIKNFTVCLSQAVTWEVGSSLQGTLRRGQGEDTGAEIRRRWDPRGADGAQGEGSVCHFWVERPGGVSFGGIGVRACNIGSGRYREGRTQTGGRSNPSADREGDVCRGADRGASEKL